MILASLSIQRKRVEQKVVFGVYGNEQGLQVKDDECSPGGSIELLADKMLYCKTQALQAQLLKKSNSIACHLVCEVVSMDENYLQVMLIRSRTCRT